MGDGDGTLFFFDGNRPEFDIPLIHTFISCGQGRLPSTSLELNNIESNGVTLSKTEG